MDNWFQDGYRVAAWALGAGAAIAMFVQQLYARIVKWRKRRRRYDLKQSYEIDETVHRMLEELMQRTELLEFTCTDFTTGLIFLTVLL